MIETHTTQGKNRFWQYGHYYIDSASDQTPKYVYYHIVAIQDSVITFRCAVTNTVKSNKSLTTGNAIKGKLDSIWVTSGELIIIPIQETDITADATQQYIIAELGQSNMEGYDGDTSNALYPFTTSRGYYYDGSQLQYLNTLRDNANEGSHATYFADKFYALTGSKPIMVEAAKSGARLRQSYVGAENWSDTGSLRATAASLVSGAETLTGKSVLAALWCQGEGDAIDMSGDPSIDIADIKAQMQGVVDWWFNLYPDSYFLISELGRITSDLNNASWDAVRNMQNEIAAENDNVFIAFDGAKDYPSESKMADSLHYNYTGLQEMGEGFATYLANLI